MREVFRTTVEIPLEDYIKIVLLIADGEYKNLKDVINKGIELVLSQYSPKKFKKLEIKYKDVVEEIKKSKSVVKRKGVRKWNVR